MILEGLADLAYNILSYIIDFIPSFDLIVIPTGIFTALDYIAEMAGFFIPMGDVVVMLGIFVVIHYFKFFYNLFFRLWDALPFT